MRAILIPCPRCSGTGTDTHEDRHAETRQDTCERCGGTGQIAAGTGESREASFGGAPDFFDPVVEAVRADLLARSQVGIAKYGVTLARTDLDLRDWVQHAYEETLDKANYLKRVIIELDARKAAAA
jgi:hypothetical protein